MTTFGGGGCHQQNYPALLRRKPHATFHGQRDAGSDSAEASPEYWLSSVAAVLTGPGDETGRGS